MGLSPAAASDSKNVRLSAGGWGNSRPACPRRCPRDSGRSGWKEKNVACWGPATRPGGSRSPCGRERQGRGQRMSGRAAVPGHAQSVASEGVDGDHQQVAGERSSTRRDGRDGRCLGLPLGRGRRGRLRRGAAGVAAFAVLVDTVARDVLGARIDVRPSVIAVAAAEACGEPVAVSVGHPARHREQRSQAPAVVGHGPIGWRALGQSGPDANPKTVAAARAARSRRRRAARAGGRESIARPELTEPEQAVPDTEARWRRRAHRADRGRAPASRRGTGRPRTPSTPRPASASKRTPVTPRPAAARSRASRRRKGSSARAASAPGIAPIATMPAAAIVASFWLCILPTNNLLPGGGHHRHHQHATQAARMPAATARSWADFPAESPSRAVGPRQARSGRARP